MPEDKKIKMVGGGRRGYADRYLQSMLASYKYIQQEYYLKIYNDALISTSTDSEENCVLSIDLRARAILMIDYQTVLRFLFDMHKNTADSPDKKLFFDFLEANGLVAGQDTFLFTMHAAEILPDSRLKKIAESKVDMSFVMPASIL